MTIEQTVKIPANRRLTIEFPQEFPMGETILTFTPVSAKPEPGIDALTRELRDLCGPSTVDRFLETRRNDTEYKEDTLRRLFPKDGERMTPREAIEKCSGIAKGIFSSDDIIEMRRKDKELEDAQLRRLFPIDEDKD
jgi:hypothetical protein